MTVTLGVKALAEKLIKETPHVCNNCRSKADRLYFNSETGQVLSVICDSCVKAFESAIKSMGRSFCTDSPCEECGRD